MLSLVRVTSSGLHIVTEINPATNPATKFWYLSSAFIIFVPFDYNFTFVELKNCLSKKFNYIFNFDI